MFCDAPEDINVICLLTGLPARRKVLLGYGKSIGSYAKLWQITRYRTHQQDTNSWCKSIWYGCPVREMCLYMDIYVDNQSSQSALAQAILHVICCTLRKFKFGWASACRKKRLSKWDGLKKKHDNTMEVEISDGLVLPNWSMLSITHRLVESRDVTYLLVHHCYSHSHSTHRNLVTDDTNDDTNLVLCECEFHFVLFTATIHRSLIFSAMNLQCSMFVAISPYFISLYCCLSTISHMFLLRHVLLCSSFHSQFAHCRRCTASISVYLKCPMPSTTNFLKQSAWLLWLDMMKHQKSPSKYSCKSFNSTSYTEIGCKHLVCCVIVLHTIALL